MSIDLHKENIRKLVYNTAPTQTKDSWNGPSVVSHCRKVINNLMTSSIRPRNSDRDFTYFEIWTLLPGNNNLLTLWFARPREFGEYRAFTIQFSLW